MSSVPHQKAQRPPRPSAPAGAERRSASAPAPPQGASAVARSLQNEKLTIPQVCDELSVSRSTFYFWRQTGKAPRCIKLPNGEVRVRRSDLDAWLAACEEIA